MANWHFRVGADALARLPEMIKANKAEILRLKAQADERDDPAAKRSAKRALQDTKARLARCEDRLTALQPVVEKAA